MGNKKQRLDKNRKYWVHKIESNITRDHENDLKLIELGWTPIHFWGHDIIKHTEDCVNAVEEIVLTLTIDQNINSSLIFDDESRSNER